MVTLQFKNIGDIDNVPQCLFKIIDESYDVTGLDYAIIKAGDIVALINEHIEVNDNDEENGELAEFLANELDDEEMLINIVN